jgi:hypothetical protein
MDGKDWLLVVAAIVIFGGPLGHTVWRRSRGPMRKRPEGTFLINDNVRLGMTVADVGGRSLAEGAKLQRFGSLRYNNDREQTDMQKVGGA